jgi:2-amino-4-hydroxy-6-hydroxymethyldihydropteridine diphosphokinase
MINENTIFLGIGSNINKKLNVKSCLNYFNSSFKYCQISPIYQSHSYGFAGNDFYNLVVEIKSHFDIVSLKKWLVLLEDMHGRDRQQIRYSNRTLDIDILFFNEDILDEGGITIPRPEILTQTYVLKPLVDLVPNMIHPKTGQTLNDHWQKLQKKESINLNRIKLR